MQKIILARLKKGLMVAAELNSAREDFRTWIGIYPLKDNSMKDYYRVRVFSVDKKFLIDDNDVWEETMESKKDYKVKGEELVQSLNGLGIDSNILDVPWKCDYPI